MTLLKERGDFIFGPINTLDDLVTDPQALANHYIIDFDHPALGTTKMAGIPITLSETPGSVRLPALNSGSTRKKC